MMTLILMGIILQCLSNGVSTSKAFSTSIYRPAVENMASFVNNRARGVEQAKLLNLTSKFLYYRYLGVEEKLNEFISTDTLAYEEFWPSDLSLLNFLRNHQFDFPVMSIRANIQQQSVTVEYDDGSILSTELIIFESERIRYIQSHYTTTNVRFLNRINDCGGADSHQSMQALKSVRLLCLGVEFLSHDVSGDLLEQRRYLTPTSRAFGAVGTDAILAVQQKSISSGTSYSIPFPIQVSTDASCLSVDFYAHVSEAGSDRVTSQRGTDIMYLDLLDQTIVRIDTLRHADVQPDWTV